MMSRICFENTHGHAWYGLPETPTPRYVNEKKKLIKNKHTCIYQKKTTTKNILSKRLIKETSVCACFNILKRFYIKPCHLLESIRFSPR